MNSSSQGFPRTIVYIDGFNLYYGALKSTSYKWLNLERYFRLLRPNDELQKIRYFTAKIIGSHAANQGAYWSALETLPLVEIILGKFKAKQVECKVSNCNAPYPRIFSTYEEKRTDVNIGLWMLNDAQQNLCDRLILVTGDSDLVPAVLMVRDNFPKKRSRYIFRQTMISAVLPQSLGLPLTNIKLFRQICFMPRSFRPNYRMVLGFL
jgi:6-hydroxy-3-succinoylpyridine 3-monooxygenase